MLRGQKRPHSAIVRLKNLTHVQWHSQWMNAWADLKDHGFRGLHFNFHISILPIGILTCKQKWPAPPWSANKKEFNLHPLGFLSSGNRVLEFALRPSKFFKWCRDRVLAMDGIMVRHNWVNGHLQWSEGYKSNLHPESFISLTHHRSPWIAL